MSEAEELLRLCENDNLDVRYSLMALYCYFEEEGKALELLQKYKSDSAFMLLPLIRGIKDIIGTRDQILLFIQQKTVC